MNPLPPQIDCIFLTNCVTITDWPINIIISDLIPNPLRPPHPHLSPLDAALDPRHELRSSKHASFVPSPDQNLAPGPQLGYLGRLRALRDLDPAHPWQQRRERRAQHWVRNWRVGYGCRKGRCGRWERGSCREHDGPDRLGGQVCGGWVAGREWLEEVGVGFIYMVRGWD